MCACVCVCTCVCVHVCVCVCELTLCIAEFGANVNACDTDGLSTAQLGEDDYYLRQGACVCVCVCVSQICV